MLLFLSFLSILGILQSSKLVFATPAPIPSSKGSRTPSPSRQYSLAGIFPDIDLTKIAPRYSNLGSLGSTASGHTSSHHSEPDTYNVDDYLVDPLSEASQGTSSGHQEGGSSHSQEQDVDVTNLFDPYMEKLRVVCARKNVNYRRWQTVEPDFFTSEVKAWLNQGTMESEDKIKSALDSYAKDRARVKTRDRQRAKRSRD